MPGARRQRHWDRWFSWLLKDVSHCEKELGISFLIQGVRVHPDTLSSIAKS